MEKTHRNSTSPEMGQTSILWHACQNYDLTLITKKHQKYSNWGTFHKNKELLHYQSCHRRPQKGCRNTMWSWNGSCIRKQKPNLLKRMPLGWWQNFNKVCLLDNSIVLMLNFLIWSLYCVIWVTIFGLRKYTLKYLVWRGKIFRIHVKRQSRKIPSFTPSGKILLQIKVWKPTHYSS